MEVPMLEKVARAMCLADGLEEGLSEPCAIATAEREWRDWLPIARAAIAAMREPTLEMVEAADAAMRMKVAEGPGRLETLRHGYMAAISAALTNTAPATPSSE
jgi:hypothetical protein